MADTDRKADEAAPRDFAEWMRDHRRGQALYEMSAALRTVVEAVAHTQKKGEITLKITITPDEQLGVGAVMVNDVIATKIPQPTKAKSLFYITGDWDLVRHDPRQMTFPEKAEGEQDD